MRQLPCYIPRLLTGVALVGVLALAGCGSDNAVGATTTVATTTVTANTAATDTAETGSTAGPEAVQVDPAVVTAGLHQLPDTIDTAIAAIGTPDAKAKLDAIESEWFSFEGTVRNTDAALYLDIEDQLTPLQRQIEAGDADTAKTTAATLSGIFDQYLAKYP